MELVKKYFKNAKIDKDSAHDVVLFRDLTHIPKAIIVDLFNGKYIYKRINLDKDMAYVIAIQAIILSGKGNEKVLDFLLLDDTTLLLEIRGCVMNFLIPCNTFIPTKKERFYLVDNQRRILVYKGERTQTKDINLISKFELSGIPPARQGVP
eukprot:Gb_01405 [translate_table: standard]